MKYQSKKHEKYVRNFKEKDVIVGCIYQEAVNCVSDCPKFYDCWVKEKDLKGGLEKKSTKIPDYAKMLDPIQFYEMMSEEGR